MSDEKFKIVVGILGVFNLVLFWCAPDKNMLNGIIGGVLVAESLLLFN